MSQNPDKNKTHIPLNIYLMQELFYKKIRKSLNIFINLKLDIQSLTA
jgi:hypothetical protein